ncbi:MAG: sulfite exporter TauE/SafE family protein [Methanomassiliicoccales archaeon]
MEPLTALGIILFASLAGLIGSLLGLGGGIIIVPVLALVFRYSMQQAIGTSLMAVIATSIGSSSKYVGQGLSNVRLGLVLSTVTSLGSLIGALFAVYMDQRLLAAVFAWVLLYTAFSMTREKSEEAVCASYDCGVLDLSCAYKEGDRDVEYATRNLGKGMLGSLTGGVQSGMLGVGGGVINVPVMRLWMGVPLRAACATSNYMIGLTALAGAIVYYQFGLIQALLAAVVAIGVFLGAVAGSRLSCRVQGRTLKLVFSVVLVSVAALMALKALGVMP